jgi:hypothetical protein
MSFIPDWNLLAAQQNIYSGPGGLLNVRRQCLAHLDQMGP